MWEIAIMGILSLAKDFMKRAQDSGEMSAEARARVNAEAASIFGQYENAAPPPPPPGLAEPSA